MATRRGYPIGDDALPRRLEPPVLYLISPPSGPYAGALPEVFEAGVDWFQFRRPGLDDRRAIEELSRVANVCRNHGVALIVNDRPDRARMVGARGVHLGEDDVPPSVVAEHWPEMLVGATQRHRNPFEPGADYYSVGPVFAPRSKQLDETPCGWEGVGEVIERAERPVLAIAGMTPSRVRRAPEGLSGVAVISGVWEAPDPAAAVRVFREALRG